MLKIFMIITSLFLIGVVIKVYFKVTARPDNEYIETGWISGFDELGWVLRKDNTDD